MKELWLQEENIGETFPELHAQRAHTTHCGCRVQVSCTYVI